MFEYTQAAFETKSSYTKKIKGGQFVHIEIDKP